MRLKANNAQASGHVGSYITKHLLKTGKHTVTAITRTESTATFPDGAQVKKVDYANEDSLVDALKGQQFLIISLSVTSPPGTQTSIINAAARAGVPWVLPNSFTGDIKNERLTKEALTMPGILQGIKDVEAAGVSSWVCLVTSFWYEWSLALPTPFYGFDIPTKQVEFIDDGTVKINTTTWEQIGRSVAALLSLKELPDDANDTSVTLSRWRNEPLYVSSFLVSQRDMLDSLNRVMNLKDSDWTIKSEPHQERLDRGMKAMQAGDRMGFATALYTRVFFPGDDGNYEAKGRLDNEVLGLPREDLDEATKLAVNMTTTDWRQSLFG